MTRTIHWALDRPPRPWQGAIRVACGANNVGEYGYATPGYRASCPDCAALYRVPEITESKEGG